MYIKNVLSITNHQGNTNRNHSEMSPAKKTTKMFWRGCREKGTLCAAGGYVDWCSYYGHLYGGSSKN